MFYPTNFLELCVAIRKAEEAIYFDTGRSPDTLYIGRNQGLQIHAEIGSLGYSEIQKTGFLGLHVFHVTETDHLNVTIKQEF